MKKSILALWFIPSLLLFAPFVSTTARADTIVASGGNVMAIDGITLNGTLYNVTFTDTLDNTFTAYTLPSSTINGIVSAINTALGSDTINDASGVEYGIAAANSNDAADPLSEIAEYCSTSECTPAQWIVAGTEVTAAYADGVNEFPDAWYWANFTPAVTTPEPSAFSLMLIGLGSVGLMVVVRKRVALRRLQST